MAFVTSASWIGIGLGLNSLLGNPVGKALGGDSGGQAGQISTYAADTAAEVGKQQWNYYVNNYQPLESSLIGQAKAAGSPEEYARARGEANADVTGSFDKARKQSLSRMQSYGINPGSPAFQSAAASTDIAEGAAKAGALTQATNNVRNLAYSKQLDVAGLGRNIPAQSAASAANASNAATNASRNLYAQNTQNMQNLGYGVNTLARNLGTLSSQWFSPSVPNYNQSTSSPGGFYYAGDSAGADSGGVGAFPYAKGGRVGRYASGGIVMKHPITPHMRFAGGGGVGRSGNAMPDQSNMGATIDNETGQVIGPGTGTSDSVPAQIDGQKPAALSNGEFVVNKDAVDMTGAEMLEAINKAGLKKRQRAGISPSADDGAMDSNDVSRNAGEEAYADGGQIGHRTMIYSGAGLGERNA